MIDISDPTILWTKWALFLLLGCLASTIVVLEANSFRAAILLAIAVWAFCRAYYFAFNVIEKYVDPGFRYAGILSLLEYWFSEDPQLLVLGQARARQKARELEKDSSLFGAFPNQSAFADPP